MNIKARICDCGETFKPKREAQRFCSAACGSAYRMARMRSRNKDGVEGAPLMGTLIALPERQFRASSPRQTASAPVTKLPRERFCWRGLVLHIGKRPVLTLVPDATFQHLFRIRYPDRLDEPSRQSDEGEGCGLWACPLSADPR